MKKLQIATIILFFLLLSIPVLTFNRKENVVSEIDNRELMNNPFGKNYKGGNGSGDLTEDIESYVQDRIGCRDEMILGYTVLNDKIFHKMVHPTYDYGKEGYVFFKTDRNIQFSEYHVKFAEMVKKLQDSCEERDIPFVFVFNPAKVTVLSEKLKDGINYDAGWVKEFLELLDEEGVNYVDNTPLLIEKTEQGEMVFNKVYNAGHWNDLGAFYGSNAIIENLQQFYPELHVNQKDEYEIKQKLNTSLQVSEFPISEYEPIFELKEEVEDVTEQYSDVKLDDHYREFKCFANEKRRAEGAPRVLSFQGSYMNGMGYKFLENCFSEYYCVQGYQNVLNFDYYYEIFHPDCVIFETAEYTLTPTYYNIE